jgi:GNAT superfamily N-acetyltransferase
LKFNYRNELPRHPARNAFSASWEVVKVIVYQHPVSIAPTYVRELQSLELQALLLLYAHLHESDDPMPPAADVEAVWAEALANPRIKYIGGFSGDSLVSSCTLTVIPNLTRGCRPYGVIENVVTHAAYRRQGWGKAVLAHALDEAWHQRCYKVMLLTGRKDAATLGFYEQAGFDSRGKQAFLAKPAV